MYRVTGELKSENLYFKKFLKIVLLLNSISEVKQSLGGQRLDGRPLEKPRSAATSILHKVCLNFRHLLNYFGKIKIFLSWGLL
jgi:hypothetical protein